VLLVVLIACAAPPPAQRSSTTIAAPTSTPINTPAAAPATATFTNPVLDRDFPDPDVIKVDGQYYAYATNSGGINIQVARSRDLVNWSVLMDGLPTLPAWASRQFGYVWAPEVSSFDGKTFTMYYVARFKMGVDGGTQCIGIATSVIPQGPFQSPAEDPFICQTGEGGSIDPAVFTDDDGSHWLLWKNDGNSGGGQTWIYLQRLSDDGQSLEGEPARLITADQAWEGVLVEAPTLLKRDGKYYLFYSANAYNDRRYAVGYAVADQIEGPYTKPSNTPLLSTRIPAGIVGPGGQDMVIDADGELWMLFHAWSSAGYRHMNAAKMNWENSVPSVSVTREPQPVP
jgi:beta-xylosidase